MSAREVVAVVGGGVVGCAVALELARRGAPVELLEAEDDLARAASGANSGILHTGFDSTPGELETRLILRSAALRGPVLDALGVPVLRCGAELRPRDPGEREAVAALARGAAANGVRAEPGGDGTLRVPGESVTDPVAWTRALAAAAQALGARVRTGARVEALRPAVAGVEVGVAGGTALQAAVVVNCAGLHADAVARLAGDASFEIYPRKGEFVVYDLPLDRILLPLPTARTKGVLVFPTLDGRTVAGPTAIDGTDKGDRRVRAAAREEVRRGAARLLPELAELEPVGAWAGLRPAGRGANYVIGPSAATPRLVNVAAIRSTGLSASLGIAEHVAGLVTAAGVPLGAPAPLPRLTPAPPDPEPWWRRAAR